MEICSVFEKDLMMDVDVMFEWVDENIKIVFFVNLNNLMGSYIFYFEVKCLYDGLFENVLFVFDGVYVEYVCNNDYSVGFELVGESINVLMM